MVDSPSKRETISQRSASKNKSYVDMTGGSESETESVRPLHTSLRMNVGNKRKRADSTPVASDSEIELGEEEFEIDSIIDSRIRKLKGKPFLEYRVHWKGYDSDEDSWTVASQFDDDDPPVLNFYKKHPSKPSTANLGKAKVKPAPERAAPGRASPTPVRETTAPPSPSVRKADPTPPSRKQEAPISIVDSPVRRAPSSSLPSKLTDIRSFFGGGNKENRNPVISKGTKVEKKESVKAKGKEKEKEIDRPKVKAGSPKPEKKKRKTEEEDEDFVMMDDGKDEEPEDDLESVADDDGDAQVESGEDDLESERESVDEKPSNAKKGYNGGWGGAKTKVKKKVVPSLGSFRSGVKPLGMKNEIRHAIKNLSEDLPPISDIEQMFDHLVSRVPDVVKIVERLNGRKLRVATMCSGTESPLLALNMIAKAIKSQHDMTLSFEHVFSCEIEPFKQAYIERNFSPPVLFRDVTELGRKKAHTAYGSLVEVPGNVDLLIAGTSCVDYSNLNNQQQDIDANGESGRTFRGMLQWVKKNQPAIVILENVCSAPWDKVVEYFAEIDYDAQFSRLDTKEYYIPHTRTRVYLFATPMKQNGKAENLAEKWALTVKDMKRPWSTPFEAFLLDTDSPNIHRARLDLAAARDYKDGVSRKPTDWNRCESRHQRARQDEQLGYLRPLTSWQEAGVCKGLDWTWNDWLLTQTERVLDLLEISTLRMAKDGVDSGFKACIWNVSQNVDRQTGSGRTALAPCLTPNMIPWVTTRGGPVTGREALALQGIPVRELLLTSESEDQLADLAGNAMTTTVVGSSMLAALKIAVDKLTPGDDAERDAAAIDSALAIEDDAVSKRVIGENLLKTSQLDLAKVTKADLKEMLDLAERSSRHCQCEGQSGTSSPIEECTACGYRACKSCGGRPDHHYIPCKNVRVQPGEFEKRFKELLPMRVQIAGVTSEVLASLRKRAEELGKGTVTSRDWELWSKAVLDAFGTAEFRFRYMKRQYTWTAVYEAPNATLDLFLQNKTPEWRLTIKCPATEPVNSPLRGLLVHPVARLRFDVSGQDVLGGPWELCIPSRQTFKIDVIGRGELVPSWHASLGLGGHYEGTQRWSQVEVVIPEAATKALDRDLAGTYTLLPKCGQAMNSLHKKEGSDLDKGLPPLYFFFDPTRCGEAEDDSYVFSTSIERLDAATERAVIAILDPKWRESAKAQDKTNLEIRGGWIACQEAHLTAVGGSDIAVIQGMNDTSEKLDQATYSVPASALSISAKLDNEGCSHATALLTCRVPLDPAHSEPMWRQGAWGEIDILHQGNATFANLAWITERLPSLEGLSQWTTLADATAEGTACERCAPRAPKIHWIKRAGKRNKNGGKTKSTIVAFEDKMEAGRYEHALKNRPAPFVVQLRLDRDVGSFRIGLNLVSLAHRALSRLPANSLKGETHLSWRLTPGHVVDAPQPPRVFILPSNKRDPEHAQPEGFKLPLRKEQLRSLWWMLEQEKAEGKTHTFVEEEISEAALPALGWRAEGKAERPVMIRGGVIADQVGYGKTIISLALVAEASDIPAPSPAPEGLIDLKATLIVVPGHLSKQWPSEITRFTGKLFNTIVIQNMADLKNKSISELKRADIIVMAAETFETDGYWERMEYLSGQSEEWLSDKNGGRFFQDRLETAMATLRLQTATLSLEGAEAAYAQMKKAQKDAIAEAESKKEAHKTANFGKRMKGQAYRDRWDGESKKKHAVQAEGADLWEASDNEEDDDDDSEPIPVPTFRSAKGKEAYSSSDVQKNYKFLACPLMHMFRFRRVIADEFTYLDKRALAALLRLTSCYKWVLSGTPPVSDFPAIRSIAAFMGIHLGVEDDAEGNAQLQKAKAKEQTQAEKFHAFREVHSQAWHRRRDDLGQDFLNTFVRQNIAEIDDIPTVEHLHQIKLPASEGAVYLELEHHLQALEMQARKETKFKDITVGDRFARLEQALADSKTAEEALLKRCCHFTLDLTKKDRDAKSAQEACEYISGDRTTQLKGCEDDLYRTINIAVGLHLYIRRKGAYGKDDPERQHFKEWVNSVLGTKQNHGDSDAEARLVKVLERCGFKGTTWPSEVADPKAVAKVVKGEKVEDVKWRLREQSHLVRRLTKELVARVRSLRFFEVVRKLQRNGQEAKDVLEGSECEHRPSTHAGAEMAVLSCCGHVSCWQCMIQAADNQVCPKGKDNCQAAVRHTNVVKVKSLGIEGELSSGRYGAKLQKLVDLIHSIPKDERVLVFLQWEDLVPKVSEALDSGRIPHNKLYGSTKARANVLDKFQQSDSDSARVLLLKINDASAAGSNLTTANHAIFVGPLFTNSLLNYRAVETQAIGRVRRYGQDRTVHIHRLLAMDTIDMTIYETRQKELEAKPDYEKIPREDYQGKKRRKNLEVEIVSPAKRKTTRETPMEID